MNQSRRFLASGMDELARRLTALSAVALLAITATGCSGGGTLSSAAPASSEPSAAVTEAPASDAPSASTGGRAPVPGRTQPVQNTTGKHIKIALISFPESNEFFNAVKVGSDAATEVLAAYDTTVDYVTVNEFTQDAVNAAGRATLLQGYDAIAFLPLDDGACPLIEEAVAQGVKVAVFITTADCAEESGALFFHGEDLEKAWGEIAIDALVEVVNVDEKWAGKPCKAGVITGAFAISTHETMRKAIIEGLKRTNISPVSDGVEAENDLSKVGPAARAYVTGNPDDLCAIIVNIGDAGAAAAALTDEQAEHIKVMSADFTVGGVEQMRQGKQAILIGQDPFGEAYDTAMLLYNAIVTGEDPGFYQPVVNSVMTPDNIDELMKAQAEGTAPE